MRNPSAAHRPHQKRKRVRRRCIFRAVARSAFSVTEAAPFFQIFLVLNLPLYSPPKRSFSWMLSFLVWDRLFCSLGSSLSLVMNGCVFSISCFSLLCFLGKFVLVPAFSVAEAFRRWEILFWGMVFMLSVFIHWILVLLDSEWELPLPSSNTRMEFRIYWAGPSTVYLILVRTAFVQDFLREIASNIEEVGNRLIALIFWIQSTSL